MRTRVCSILVLLGIIGSSAALIAQSPQPRAGKPAFEFNGAAYFHRWSKNQQHEFTPEGQEDLGKWTDMITLNVYPAARDGDALSAQANGVLENYKKHNARVLKTDSLPRTPERPAEHFIAVVFAQPQFIEVVFARFRLADGTGSSVVYSHRIYGEKAGDEASAWLKANGPKLENALMSSTTLPSPASFTRKAL